MLTRSALHTIVKAIFASAAERFRRGGDGFAGQADLRTVRDNLRHASLTSTNIYLHTPDEDRHRETEEKRRIDW